jgi:hypothetical protein
MFVVVALTTSLMTMSLLDAVMSRASARQPSPA